VTAMSSSLVIDDDSFVAVIAIKNLSFFGRPRGFRFLIS
jgi:hypothetical protein